MVGIGWVGKSLQLRLVRARWWNYDITVMGREVTFISRGFGKHGLQVDVQQLPSNRFSDEKTVRRWWGDWPAV